MIKLHRYNPNISLGSDFMKPYQTTSAIPKYYQDNQSTTAAGTSGYDFDKFKSAYANATGIGNKVSITSDGQIVTDFGNYDPSNTYHSYLSNTQTSNSNPFFDQFSPDTIDKDMLISMYGAPGSSTGYYSDGGRVGLFMGGDPLTGQALSIYDSMKAYNFSDQEIANALSARGLSELGTSNIPDTTSSQTIGYQDSGGNGDGKTTSIAPGTLKSQYQTSINNPINNAIYDFKENMTTKLSDPTTKMGKLGINASNVLGGVIGLAAGIPGLGFVLDKLSAGSEFDRGAIRELNAPMQLGTYNKDRTGTGYFSQGPVQPGISSLSDTYKSGLTNGQFGGVTVDDLGRIQQTGAYNTAENVMAGYNAGFDLGGTAFDRYD